MSNLHSERCSNEEVRNKMSEIGKRNWKDPEYASKVLSAVAERPNKWELKLLDILNDLAPNEWKYVGDGSFIINGKNPDFINVNGKKLLIELYGEFWHQGHDPKERIDCFKPFGYDTMIIWCSELNKKNYEITLERIKEFIL